MVILENLIINITAQMNKVKHIVDKTENCNNIHENHNENRTKIVVIITAITMIVEILFGYTTNSMALLADGWHMASHVFALGLTWIAYFVSRKYSNTKNHSFNKNKLLSLSGFTSAIILFIVAIVMTIESITRLINPAEIKFSEAIIVATIGFIVNLISALFLHDGHNHDHNIRSAYLHVLADGLTSLTAIIALIIGMIWNIYWLDCISGILSSVVITKWAVELMWGSGKDLIDFTKNSNLQAN